MITKRDKVRILYFMIVIGCLIYLNFIKGISVILGYSILIYFWYDVICYRRYVMTINNLLRYSKDDELEYCTYEYNVTNYLKNCRRKIYVRNKSINSDWYEIEYDLTIGKDSYLSKYIKFISENNTVERLLSTMNKNSKYKLREINYRYYCNMSLIFIILFIIVHMIIYF